mmetsp:Transcript_10494/g.22387  ORF Transcript_10494/g.22387 Transcript_10494/m.22387 type:complete len:94 (+) Transcript_10494:720-1001(+)
MNESNQSIINESNPSTLSWYTFSGAIVVPCLSYRALLRLSDSRRNGSTKENGFHFLLSHKMRTMNEMERVGQDCYRYADCSCRLSARLVLVAG